MNGYRDYQDESDADDEYERSMMSPNDQDQFPQSPGASDGHSAENTPTIYQRSGAAVASPRGLITRWTQDDTAEFITNLGLGEYAEAFIDDEITGEALTELLHEELIDLGIESVGHRMTILRSVYDVKMRQNVPMMHDHYVPPSAESNAPDAHATQDDVARIINQIKLRDERLLAAEEDLRLLREDLNRALEESRRMREDVLPALRKAKDRDQPLPTPDATNRPDLLPSPQDAIYPDSQKPSGGLSRKFSKKGLFSGSGKMPSPTIHESATLNPSAAAQAASAQLSASMTSQNSQPSPRPTQLPSPTSPPYTQSMNPRGAPSSRYASHPATEDPWTNYSNGPNQSDRNLPSSRRTPALAQTQAPASIAEEMQQTQPRDRERDRDRNREPQRSANDQGMEFMKSFRVSMEESCYKVLPIALRKYQIDDDWRHYSLYIVHGDQERCLGLHEKPLILFKQLASEGKKPMFMLRKHAAPQEGYNVQRSDMASDGPAGVGSLSGSTLTSNIAGRASGYASSVQLPGGVL